ncbi:acyl carrier protein [Kitasatospora aburaviensis]
MHDVFLDLGGHSLLAAGLLAGSSEFGTRVPLTEFFAAPTVAALAVRVANGGGGRPPSHRPSAAPACPPARPRSSTSSGCTSPSSPAPRSTTCRCGCAPPATSTSPCSVAP